MDAESYVAYAKHQHDERPLYLFDPDFPAEDLYKVPEIFSRDDFFRYLGHERPKFRWLIAGPKRSGSSFHVDPNYTNAWNACLTGRKRWLLFPPGYFPPGVYPSSDMADVTTPVSLTEWLLNYYSATVQAMPHVGYEAVCRPGDVMFVPCGWWHFVVNIDDSIAITQNYVSRTNLEKVVLFLRTMPTSISGVGEDDGVSETQAKCLRKELSTKFLDALRAAEPELMERMEKLLESRHSRKRHRQPLELLDRSDEGFTFNF
jgi:oxalate decarboxylase/phosphoglucose isomerase-like protein (cupin superfamily)